MSRAGVFIGVDQTGGLQKLNDAAAGARRMHAWAVAQGMPDKTHAKLITDESGKVSASQIFTAIQDIIDGPGVDQLVLYFAGHGVNINFGEMWLLSDAPRNPNEAVNLRGSVELARYCGINHVVVISDACRVAPDGIQAGNVRGQEIFPNDGAGDRARPVDQFFACVLGRTAAEIRDPAVAAGTFSALYTDALLDALNGNAESALRPAPNGDANARCVFPEPLQQHLAAAIPARVAELKLEKKVNQSPDAILMRHDFWLSRINGGIGTATGAGPMSPAAAPTSPTRSGAPAPSPPRETLRALAKTLVKSAAQSPADLERAIVRARVSGMPGATPLTDNIEQVAAPFGPDHFETQCGIKVRGARVAAAHSRRDITEVIAPPGELVRVHPQERAASVLVEFDNGHSAVIPALRDFIAALTFENGELIDVTYEPSANSGRWNLYAARAPELRALRAVAAAASRHGRFRLDSGPDALDLAQRMQYAKGIDPTFAVYAAYAYHDLQALERVREMSDFLRSDIGTTFFDLSLLCRQLRGKRVDANAEVMPFVPLLSQGWSLLRANRIRLHPALDGIEDTLCDSLWSLFNPRGTEMLKAALKSGELR